MVQIDPLVDRLNKLDKNEIIDIVKNLAEYNSKNLKFINAFMDKKSLIRDAKTVTDKNVKTIHFISKTIDELIDAKENNCYDGYEKEDSIWEELKQLHTLMSTLLKESNIKSIKDLSAKDKFYILLKEHKDTGCYEDDDFLQECKSILRLEH